MQRMYARQESNLALRNVLGNLKWRGASQEVDQHVADGFQVVAAALLYAQVRVHARVPVVIYVYLVVLFLNVCLLF